MSQPQPDKRYTWSDYESWDDDIRYELINGIPYMMSPAPSLAHQTVSGGLFLQLATFLQDRPCKVFAAPCDVRLNADENDDTVVQPDLLVVCDMSKLDGKACVGAPDMIIEIMSPSTSRRDKLTKFQLYQKAGVHEYWIVDMDTRTIQVCILNNGRYMIDAWADTDTVPVHVLEGCFIDLSKVFPEQPSFP